MEEELDKKIDKRTVINYLENEKWMPGLPCTDIEYETSKLLNAILDDIISRIIKL